MIRLQNRWREKRAVRRVSALRAEVERRELAAIFLQRIWYTFKGAFVTFLLMSCYREFDLIDKSYAGLATSMGRKHAAKVLQKYYHDRFVSRLMSNVVRLQCWYRACQGYNYVKVMRRQRWAVRKLHHWARVRMRHRHEYARTIQNFWWGLKPGRRLR